LVGGVDSGKTTFAAYLVNETLRAHRSCAVVDADIGQSSIGPPGTVSLGFPDNPVEELKSIPMAFFYFVGAISPQRHLLPCVVGVKKMVEAARSRAGRIPDKIVVDTTGLVQGRLGRTLKEYKLDALEPDNVVFFQRRRELESLARLWERKSQVYRLEVGPQVERKTFEVRARNRAEKWRQYFHGSTEHEFSFKDVAFTRGVLGTGQPLGKDWRENLARSLTKDILWMECSPERNFVVTREQLGEEELARLSACAGLGRSRILQYRSADFEGVLVALVNESGSASALGIVTRVDFKHEIIKVLSPLSGDEKIWEIQFGDYRFPLGQREITS
jgi:polynucleotide 5'-hydroxyl-kinase GRC3/NOL9